MNECLSLRASLRDWSFFSSPTSSFSFSSPPPPPHSSQGMQEQNTPTSVNLVGVFSELLFINLLLRDLSVLQLLCPSFRSNLMTFLTFLFYLAFQYLISILFDYSFVLFSYYFLFCQKYRQLMLIAVDKKETLLCSFGYQQFCEGSEKWLYKCLQICTHYVHTFYMHTCIHEYRNMHMYTGSYLQQFPLFSFCSNQTYRHSSLRFL